MLCQMRPILLVLTLTLSSAAAAQTPPASPPVPWNPAGPYITAGQDEPGYRSWYLASPTHAAQVRAFNNYLAASRVAGVFPTWQLLRTATSWQDCGGQPFEVPPPEQWPNIVNTLRYIHDYVVPAIGPVEAVSVYRNPQLNECAGGAVESAHKLDSAIDMVPLRPIERVPLMRTLCADHTKHGADYRAGLGFYAFVRFHVDSTKFRRWNMDPAVAAECPPIVHPEDAGTVAQPLPQAVPLAPAPQPERGLPR
jgi:hypothetical protein